MMKKQVYEPCDLEITFFTTDVITSSGWGSLGEDNNYIDPNGWT